MKIFSLQQARSSIPWVPQEQNPSNPRSRTVLYFHCWHTILYHLDYYYPYDPHLWQATLQYCNNSQLHCHLLTFSNQKVHEHKQMMVLREWSILHKKLSFCRGTTRHSMLVNLSMFH